MSPGVLSSILTDMTQQGPWELQGAAEKVYFKRNFHRSAEDFKWLDRAYEQKDVGLSHIKGEVPFKSLESDPRYKAFLKKMNLPE